MVVELVVGKGETTAQDNDLGYLYGLAVAVSPKAQQRQGGKEGKEESGR